MVGYIRFRKKALVFSTHSTNFVSINDNGYPSVCAHARIRWWWGTVGYRVRKGTKKQLIEWETKHDAQELCKFVAFCH